MRAITIFYAHLINRCFKIPDFKHWIWYLGYSKVNFESQSNSIYGIYKILNLSYSYIIRGFVQTVNQEVSSGHWTIRFCELSKVLKPNQLIILHFCLTEKCNVNKLFQRNFCGLQNQWFGSKTFWVCKSTVEFFLCT